MRLILDAMGGDDAPGAIVAGTLAAARDFSDCRLVLVGRKEAIEEALKKQGCGTLPENIEIQDAREVIEMCDDPANAFRRKKDSSMTVGLRLLKADQGDAFISAGSTGALLSASTLLVKRSPGIRRAAAAPVIPTACQGAVLIDGGTNAECTPEYLVQFAFMGAIYAQYILGRENPRVGLLNIGSEAGKGDTLRQETYLQLTRLAQEGQLNFVGNIEAREVVSGQADVIVADGFSGNILLKAMEGTAMFLSELLKDTFTRSLRTKLGYLMVQDGIAEMKKLMDYREVGGSCLLGIQKPVIKAHGSSDERAIYCAIRQARNAVACQVCDIIAEHAVQPNG